MAERKLSQLSGISAGNLRSPIDHVQANEGFVRRMTDEETQEFLKRGECRMIGKKV
jgi:hypothetical protein